MYVRAAIVGDAPHLAELAAQLGYPADASSLARRFDQLSRSADDAVFVVVGQGSEVCGWLHVLAARRLTSQAWAEIVGLVVDTAQRGRGLGRLLVEAAETWASEHGLDTLRVRTNVQRVGAPAFYQALGFDLAKQQSVLARAVRRAD